MGPSLIVPRAERVEVGPEVFRDSDGLPPRAEALLEAPEESLDPAVLPRAERVNRLVSDAQGEEFEAHECYAAMEDERVSRAQKGAEGGVETRGVGLGGRSEPRFRCSGWNGSSILFLMAFSARLAVAGDEALVPVPADLVHGTRLTVSAWNLIIDAPSTEWTWLMAPEMAGRGSNRFQGLACMSPNPAVVFRVGVFEAYHVGLTAENAADFARGSAATLQQSGWQAEVLESQPSDLPLPGSYRFVIQATSARGSVRLYSYLAAKSRMFSFQHVTAATEEPAEFHRFVQSFRFTGAPVEDPFAALGQVHFALAAAITAFIGMVGWGINKVARRPLVNLWYLVVAVLLIGGIGLHIYFAPRLPADASPFQQGELWGRIVGGPIGWPLLFAVWRAWAVRRRRLMAGRGADVQGAPVGR